MQLAATFKSQYRALTLMGSALENHRTFNLCYHMRFGPAEVSSDAETMVGSLAIDAASNIISS
jgi:hypothetical protein